MQEMQVTQRQEIETLQQKVARTEELGRRLEAGEAQVLPSLQLAQERQVMQRQEIETLQQKVARTENLGRRVEAVEAQVVSAPVQFDELCVSVKDLQELTARLGAAIGSCRAVVAHQAEQFKGEQWKLMEAMHMNDAGVRNVEASLQGVVKGNLLSMQAFEIKLKDFFQSEIGLQIGLQESTTANQQSIQAFEIELKNLKLENHKWIESQREINFQESMSGANQQSIEAFEIELKYLSQIQINLQESVRANQQSIQAFEMEMKDFSQREIDMQESMRANQQDIQAVDSGLRNLGQKEAEAMAQQGDQINALQKELAAVAQMLLVAETRQ